MAFARTARPDCARRRGSRSMCASPAALRRMMRARNRKFADSPVEGTGFEISVPRYRRWSRGSPKYAIRAEQRVASEFVSTRFREGTWIRLSADRLPRCRRASAIFGKNHDNPRVRSDTGLIARANSDDNPLPQAEPVAITPTPTDLLEVGVRQSRSPLPRHRPPRRRRQGLQRGADHLPRDLTAAFRSFRTAYPMTP
jgi:hypothetical protein